ncbi:MAG: LamG-like jellyroll fold domain-containing protein [Candidatus Sulfotelmatobacter sp.]
MGAKWTNGPSPGGGALAFRDHANEYPPPAELSYVRVRNSDSLNPIKGFDIAANVYIDPSFSPMFAADIVEKGDGYGCSYRLLITNDFKLEAVAGNEHSALVSSTKLPLGRWVSARATYDGRTLKIYIDGKEDASMAVQTKSLASQDDLIIGRRFTGKLADIVVTAE